MATSAPPAAGQRCVVLHADDFGMSEAVTQGILRGFSHGLLTSTSVLTNGPDFYAAVSSFRALFSDSQRQRLPSAATRLRLGDSLAPFDFGVHLNLTQGRPMTGSRYPAELLDQRGRFPGVWSLARRLCTRPERYRAAITAELDAQIEMVANLGIHPTHLNGHQYCELLPGIPAIIRELLQKHRIRAVRMAREGRLWRSVLTSGRALFPFRWALAHIKQYFSARFERELSGSGVVWPATYFGMMHAGRITLPLMQLFLEGAVPTGMTEIGLHPAQSPGQASRLPPDGWFDPLSMRRVLELAWLVSPELADCLETRQLSLGRIQHLSSQPARVAA